MMKWFFIILYSCILFSCAPTPNDVILTFNNAQCVTAGHSSYEAQATEFSTEFAINKLLPESSPYCLAVTIQNNNSGKNANNIEVDSYGLVLTYVNPTDNTAVSDSLIDYNAAQLTADDFYYDTVQQTHNIALFDPENCVTTIGANVHIIPKDGGSCTFYLQLIAESLPISLLPITMNLNYTNGNADYNISANLMQTNTLYAGGNFNAASTVASNANNGISPDTASDTNITDKYIVTALTKDIFANLYSGDIVGNIYQYNGSNELEWQLLGSVQQEVTALASDSIGNTYILAQDGKLYRYSAAYSVQIPQITYLTTISQLKYPINMITLGDAVFISSSNNIYSCNELTEVPICSFFISGPDETINQMLGGNNIYIATNTGLWSYSGNGSWLSIPSAGNTGLPLNYPVSALARYDNNWYAGISNTNPGVFISVSNADYLPLLSVSAASINGNITQLLLDSNQTLFVAGSNLMTSDSIYNSPIMYLRNNAQWGVISNITGNVNALQTTSHLSAI